MSGYLKLPIRARYETVIHSGTLLIKEGAKNGRSRVIELEIEKLERQATILLLCMSYTNDKYGSLVLDGKTTKQCLSLHYRVCRKAGLTKDGDYGLTSHSFRHEDLNRLFEKTTGKPSPVRGGTDFDPLLLKEAMLKVTKRAGHNQPVKSGAYVDTPRTMARHRKKQEDENE